MKMQSRFFVGAVDGGKLRAGHRSGRGDAPHLGGFLANGRPAPLVSAQPPLARGSACVSKNKVIGVTGHESDLSIVATIDTSLARSRANSASRAPPCPLLSCAPFVAC